MVNFYAGWRRQAPPEVAEKVGTQSKVNFRSSDLRLEIGGQKFRPFLVDFWSILPAYLAGFLAQKSQIVARVIHLASRDAARYARNLGVVKAKNGLLGFSHFLQGESNWRFWPLPRASRAYWLACVKLRGLK